MSFLTSRITKFLSELDWKSPDVLTGVALWVIVAGVAVVLVHVIAAAL
jgi:hypothetical protein